MVIRKYRKKILVFVTQLPPVILRKIQNIDGFTEKNIRNSPESV